MVVGMHLLRTIWISVSNLSTVQTVAQWVGVPATVSAVLAVITLGSGVFQHTPLVFVEASSAVVFAGVWVGINHYDMWKGRNRTSGTLSDRTILFTAIRDPNERDALHTKIAVVLFNKSQHREVYYRINRINTSINGNTTIGQHFLSTTGMLPAGAEAPFYDSVIFTKIIKGSPNGGTAEYSFQYGPSPKYLPFELIGKKHFELYKSDPQLEVYGIHTICL